MPPETEPTDEELAPIKKALEERLSRSDSSFTEEDIINLAKNYYSICHSTNVDEGTLNVFRAVAESYITGFNRARHLYEVPDDDSSVPF
ncbi:MAG TPA: hypothetical protein VJ142_02675 [Candidatus Nanoarchaeia archaeon]|nr:hypothetical protein [Candidatus Nanoarchaeia archaeon]